MAGIGGFQVRIDETQLTRLLGVTTHVAGVFKELTGVLRRGVTALEEYNAAHAAEIITLRMADGSELGGPRHVVNNVFVERTFADHEAALKGAQP